MTRPPARLSNGERQSTNVKRSLRALPLDNAARDHLIERSHYEPYAKHKRNPLAFGLEPVPRISEDPTYCDEHAGFTPNDMARIPVLLRRGIYAGLTSEAESSGVPRILWTVDDNGWVYEARLTNAGVALYHGYPLLPGDAMANKVIARFIEWIEAGAEDDQIRFAGLTRENAANVALAAEEFYSR